MAFGFHVRGETGQAPAGTQSNDSQYSVMFRVLAYATPVQISFCGEE